MKIRAVKGFAGVVSMRVGEVKNVPDEIARDLIQAGHARAVKKPPEIETVANEDQRSD